MAYLILLSWLFFNFSPHSFKIYVEKMQLTKETEKPLERFLCLLMNLVKMVFLKMHVTGGKKMGMVHSLNLALFLYIK